MLFLGDDSGATVGAVAHHTESSFSFLRYVRWSLYPSTFGQAIASAFGHLASAVTIANVVGIKKQSIYTHFKGKDELFLQVCSDVFANELSYVVDFIESNIEKKPEQLLLDFLLSYIVSV